VAEHWGLSYSLALAGGGCLLVALVFSLRPVLRAVVELPHSQLAD
jgi:hypothetical protein